MKKKTAFSLIELSIVVLIIGLIVAGVIGAKKLVSLSNLSKARALTNSSPVNGIEGLILWLETTSKDSFNPAPTDNTAISIWYDINPQQNVKNHARQATLANRPVYKENLINNLGALSFDGNQFFMVDNESNFDTAVFSTFVVSSGTGTYFGKNSGATDARRRKLEFRNDYFEAGNDGDNHISIGTTNQDILGVRAFISSSNTNHRIWFNGVKTTSSLLLHNDQFNDSSFQVGGLFGSASETLTGNIGEIIIFNRDLSDEEATDIMNYLSKKWGIKLQ